MGKIAQALLPAVRTPRSLARRDDLRDIGPVGGQLVKMADAAGWTPHDLAKAVTREAGRVSSVSELAARLGVDPTMGAPFASWDNNRMSAAQMGPGAPARPYPLGGEPRQFQYRVGFNFPSPPDGDRGVDAQLLRVLADSFDLMRLCIEIRKHDISQLAWDVVPVEKNRSKRDQWLKENAKEMGLIRNFFEWPEAYMTQDAAGHWVRRGKVKWEDWLGALLEDYFVGDWLTIWPRTLRNGGMLAFDRVDGATIKPLLDLDGRLPEPPTPAYQQYLFGVPRASFTLEELLYRPRLVRNHSVFGFSHVEQMLVLINMALRFQMWNTQGYTDGSLPLGLLVFPENFSPDQIEAVVEELNASISGLAAARQQFHGVPYGTDWKDLKPFSFDETFAQYVVEYTAAMFGLNAQKLGFMPGRGGQGLGGKGFAEQQSADAEGKSTMPDARWVEGLMNELIERCFGRDDLRFVFTDLQDTDEKGQIDADQAAILAGLKSWDQALEERGEEPVGISEPFIVIGNTPWTVTDLKAAQEGEPRNPQLPALPIDEQPDDGSEGGAGGGVPPIPPAGPGDGSGEHAGPQPAAPRSPGPAANQTEEKPAPGEVDTRQDGKPGREKEAPANRQEKKPAGKDTEKFDTSSGMQPHGLVGPDVDELRRWKRMATKAAREGRRVRPFQTDLIPDAMKTLIADSVAYAGSVDEVRAIFDTAIDIAKRAHPMGGEGLAWANYRPQDTPGGVDCQTCSYFRAGNCSMFAVNVEPDYVCDEWTGDQPTDKAAKTGGALYLIRHGATKLNEGPNREDRIRGWLDPPLIEAGKDQAEADAAKLADSGITRIYSSDLARAADTANLIGDHLRVPVTTSVDFRPWNLGDFQGAPAAEVAPKLHYYAEHPDEKVPGGESFNSFCSRYLGAFEKLRAQADGGDTLGVVTHYRNVKLTQAVLKGGEGVDLDQFFTDDLKPGDVIRLNGDRWQDINKAAKTEEKVTVGGLCVRATDTGRVLMLQRSISADEDPAAGKWEFPGGHLEPGESPLQGAIREWQEETGATLPKGETRGSWRNGIYQAFVYVIPHESDLPLNDDADDRHVLNPDDPDGDDIEVVAWWPPSDARTMPGLREEAKKGTDWGVIDEAVPDAKFKTVLVELAKASDPGDEDSARERHIKELTAAAGAVLAVQAAAAYGARAEIGRQTDDTVAKLAQHYRQAAQAGSRAAASAHGIPELAPEQLDKIAAGRAEAQRGNVRALVEQSARDGDVKPQAIHLLARGSKPAYEQGFGATVTAASPEALAVWRTLASDPCNQCADRDGQVFTVDELPGWPGDGDFGGDLCDGGPNDRCELEWRIPGDSGAEDDDPGFRMAATPDLEKDV